MGRTSEARQSLVDAACELMRGRGYGALGVAEICARADVRKGSFYYFFESKQALTVEALRAEWAARREEWTAALAGGEPPLHRLARLVERQAEAQRTGRQAHGVVRGCLFGNLALELSNKDEAVHAVLEEIFDDQIALVLGVLDECAAENAIPRDRADRATARALIAQLEGMVLFAKLDNDPAVLDDLWAQVKRLLA